MPPQNGNVTITKAWIGKLVITIVGVLLTVALSGAVLSMQGLREDIKANAQAADKNAETAAGNKANLETQKQVMNQCVTDIKDDIGDIKNQMEKFNDALSTLTTIQAQQAVTQEQQSETLRSIERKIDRQQ